MQGRIFFFKCASLFLGTMLVLLGLVITIAAGPSINNFLTFLLGAFLLVLGLFYGRFPKKILRGLQVMLFAGSVFLFTMAMIIRSGAKDAVSFDEDIAVILGSGIDGTKPTPMLEARLEKAVLYFEKNPKVLFIVCGGQGHGEDIAEALAMQRYLISKKIPADRIILEDKSRNTHENLLNAKEILKTLEQKGIKTDKTVIITSDFHMYRAKKTAQNLGLSPKGMSAPLDWYMRPGTFLRETLSLLKFWILG